MELVLSQRTVRGTINDQFALSQLLQWTKWISNNIVEVWAHCEQCLVVRPRCLVSWTVNWYSHFAKCCGRTTVIKTPLAVCFIHMYLILIRWRFESFSDFVSNWDAEHYLGFGLLFPLLCQLTSVCLVSSAIYSMTCLKGRADMTVQVRHPMSRYRYHVSWHLKSLQYSSELPACLYYCIHFICNDNGHSAVGSRDNTETQLCEC